MDQVGRLGTLCVCACMFVYAVYLFIYVLNIFLLLLIYFPHRWVTAWSLMENLALVWYKRLHVPKRKKCVYVVCVWGWDGGGE